MQRTESGVPGSRNHAALTSANTGRNRSSNSSSRSKHKPSRWRRGRTRPHAIDAANVLSTARSRGGLGRGHLRNTRLRASQQPHPSCRAHARRRAAPGASPRPPGPSRGDGSPSLRRTPPSSLPPLPPRGRPSDGDRDGPGASRGAPPRPRTRALPAAPRWKWPPRRARPPAPGADTPPNRGTPRTGVGSGLRGSPRSPRAAAGREPGFGHAAASAGEAGAPPLAGVRGPRREPRARAPSSRRGRAGSWPAPCPRRGGGRGTAAGAGVALPQPASDRGRSSAGRSSVHRSASPRCCRRLGGTQPVCEPPRGRSRSASDRDAPPPHRRPARPPALTSSWRCLPALPALPPRRPLARPPATAPRHRPPGAGPRRGAGGQPSPPPPGCGCRAPRPPPQGRGSGDCWARGEERRGAEPSRRRLGQRAAAGSPGMDWASPSTSACPRRGGR
ncbi:hypothetical protein QYF61_022763 [Mycteria americana]|uniref:Uncharacterized protein n=1 Tax=Mycteria americana TaxID=33587 RepID=A0AAN7MZQ6_MYCAM|nr:hypothetical protein QYF61_022763 [Mycteria americana]